MKTATELAQEGCVDEAFDLVLGNETTAAAKHDPEEVAKIFEEALRGMPSNLRKDLEGLSTDMKNKFVQKAMRGLKSAGLLEAGSALMREIPLSELALPPEELAKRGHVDEAYDRVLKGLEGSKS